MKHEELKVANKDKAGSDAPLESVEARYKDLLFRLGVLGHDGAVAEITALRKAANLDG